MRAHHAASSASSAREKWMRPLVVGPSPVMTPSRTMVSACAAVLRQDGWSAPGNSAALALGADIITLLGFLFWAGQHFHAGVNEWLTIRNSGFDSFRWLPICRLPFIPVRGAATGPGVMAAIKGDIGAEAGFSTVVVFSPQAHGSKEDARSSRSRRRISSSG